jgi:hypothetical protein
MDRPDLYDSDILAWSEEQAAVLRRSAARGELPNDLDLENVVEEIESVGRSQLNRVESLIERILEHIIKAVSEPDAPSVAHWRTECATWHVRMLRSFSPSMRQRIVMDELWKNGLKLAELSLAEHGTTLADGLRGPCPVELDNLLSNEFDLPEIVRRIIKSEV